MLDHAVKSWNYGGCVRLDTNFLLAFIENKTMKWNIVRVPVTRISLVRASSPSPKGIPHWYLYSCTSLKLCVHQSVCQLKIFFLETFLMLMGNFVHVLAGWLVFLFVFFFNWSLLCVETWYLASPRQVTDQVCCRVNFDLAIVQTTQMCCASVYLYF